MSTMTVQERVDEITEEYWAARKSEPEDVVVARIIRLLAEAEQAWADLAEAEQELAEKENI